MFVAPTNKLLQYLEGSHNHVALTDINHNCKNTRYQIVGGSSVLNFGKTFINPDDLRVAGIKQELWRVKDFASDLLVSKLNSSDSISSLKMSHGASCTSTILSLSFYFTRMISFSINDKTCPAQDRVIYTWAGMLWFTSFAKNSTFKTNQKNIVTASIASVFLFARKGLKSFRYVTTEPIEHRFGNWRQVKHEFNALEATQIDEKSQRKDDAVAAGKLKRYRSPQKGYSATSSEYNSYTNINKQVNETVLLRESPEMLWKNTLQPLIKVAKEIVSCLLEILSVPKCDYSPFLIDIENVQQLKDIYTSYYPSEVISHQTEIENANKDITGSNKNLPKDDVLISGSATMNDFIQCMDESNDEAMEDDINLQIDESETKSLTIILND